MTNKVVWVLLAFEKHGEKLLGQHTLNKLDLVEVRKILGKPEGDPLHGCLKIPESGLAYFEMLLGRIIDKGKTEYYLEFQSEND